MEYLPGHPTQLARVLRRLAGTAAAHGTEMPAKAREKGLLHNTPIVPLKRNYYVYEAKDQFLIDKRVEWPLSFHGVRL